MRPQAVAHRLRFKLYHKGIETWKGKRCLWS
jgi:hypothetical protein